jgi:tetratricopeptide (TPR) repeat protein
VAKDWLTTIAAGVCAFGMAVTTAIASPAGMARPNRAPATTQAPVRIASKPAISADASASRPSAEISAVRNPVKYFATAVSELPRAWKSKKNKSNAVSPVVPRSDSISLDTPTGPATPQLVISMAQMSERQGDIFQARRHYQKALSTWPGHVDVLRAAARMEDRQGELRLAETLYRQAVGANPQHAGALNDLGLCMARQGQLEPSIEIIEQAIALQPEKALYRNNAATILVEMRQDQRALAHLGAVHAAAEASYNLGQLLVQRGRPADAALYFQAAIEQNPEMQAAHVALAQLQGHDFAAQGGANSPHVTSGAAIPNAGAAVVPQQQPAGPQLGYPATAQSPDFGASSYAPPRNGIRIGARPVYAPAVGNQPAPGGGSTGLPHYVR